ncbi:MAG: hypothetical protein HY393_01095 [Candidatus Diapherotrites archaeon]|nr:hypothetical protein [Candidatus Diapherotrites archaeon]
MSVSLNFSSADKEKITQWLRRFEGLPSKSPHEALRASTGNAVLVLYNSGKLLVQGKNKVIEEETKEWVMRELGKLEGSTPLVLGMDEVGRGENQGPLVVAGVLGRASDLRELRDSKKTLGHGKGFQITTHKSKAQFILAFNAELIDDLRKKGVNLNRIQAACMNALYSLTQNLGVQAKARADGGRLNEAHHDIEFIVRGDDADPVIGSASQIAKQYRTISADTKKRATWSK